MAQGKHSNISIFVPHVGCPHKCAFCDQRTITGEEKLPHAEDVWRSCTRALGEVSDPDDTEIAFFGGSFTAIPREYMTELLDEAKKFVGKGRFKGIRISTRPDCINDEILAILKDSGVTAIELGAQSMCDDVLLKNERGHSAQDVFDAARLIRSYGFELGLQLMVGLWGSDMEKERQSMEAIISIRPDTVRIYPVVILRGTRLGELFLSGEYLPMEFDDVVGLCAEMIERFEAENIRVIKCGLHASEFVEKDMVGGFYHPAFRELCESLIYRRLFEQETDRVKGCKEAHFSVDRRELSKALGQKRSNVIYFESKGIRLRVTGDGAEGRIRTIDIR